MAKDLVLEEFENYDDDFFDYDYSEDSYDNFSYEDDDYEEIEEKKFNPGSLLSVVALISIWFIRIGAVMGICLLIAFFVMGKVGTAFLFILGLIVAFFFGYGFMFCLDHFMVKES